MTILGGVEWTNKSEMQETLFVKNKPLSVHSVYKTFGFCTISDKSLRNVTILSWFLVSPTGKLHSFFFFFFFILHVKTTLKNYSK